MNRFSTAKFQTRKVSRRFGDRLALDAPDPAVGPAIELAVALLDHHGSYADPPSSRFAADVTTLAGFGLAVLATGGFDASARLIRSLAADQDRTENARVEATSRELDDSTTRLASVYLLLCARHLAWTGSIGLIREQWARILHALASLHPTATSVAHLGSNAAHLRDIALRELVVTAESIGERSVAAQLAAKADPSGPAPQSLLGTACSRFTSGDVEAAYREWHESATLLLECSDDGVNPRLAASVATTLVHGLLGVDPDAPRNRLALRPRIPRDWDELTVLNIAMADALIDLHYERKGARHTYRLYQTTGRAPVRAIFEPALMASAIFAASVDGAGAVLAPRPFGGGLVVPLQVVLDRERTLILDASD